MGQVMKRVYTPKNGWDHHNSEPPTRSREDGGEQSRHVVCLHVRTDDGTGIFRDALYLRIRELSCIGHEE